MAAEDEVRQASERFYAALTLGLNGDPGAMSAMSAIWAHGGDVTHLPPMGMRDVGWEQVRAGWEQALGVVSEGRIRLNDQLIRVGTDLAYEIGVEVGEATMAGEQVQFNARVTNVYRRDGGEWKIVHHHTDASPAMLDLLSRLQPPH
jgi:ketosteroid isomerase-like protein